MDVTATSDGNGQDTLAPHLESKLYGGVERIEVTKEGLKIRARTMPEA